MFRTFSAVVGALLLSLTGAAHAATVVPVTPDIVYEDGIAYPYAGPGYFPSPHGFGFVVFTWDDGDIDALDLYVENEITWGKVDSYDPWGVNYNESYFSSECSLASGCIKLIGQRKAYARVDFPPEWDLPCVGPDGFQCYQRVNYSQVYVSFAIRGTPGNTIGGTVTLQDHSPVPEPATWALMIMGFGLAGATLRRRRAASPKSV
jgi:hypothetical protein